MDGEKIEDRIKYGCGHVCLHQGDQRRQNLWVAKIALLKDRQYLGNAGPRGFAEEVLLLDTA